MAAYDGYRNQPDPHQVPYPASFDSQYDPRSYQPQPYHTNTNYDPPSPRSRASSRSEDAPPSQQPLNNALNHAFDKSDAARTVDPDLIAQITAEVKKSVLHEIKLNGVTGQPQPAPQPYIPQSPSSASASFPTRNVYTPPSPKVREYASHGSESPDPLARDPMFDGSGDTPTPRTEQRSAPMDIPQQRDSRSKPPMTRMATDVDFTPIEKMWQRLFDPQGNPMPRLGQFLRGLAVHLIEDYEPKKSLVITPAKMLRFYDDVKLADEIYPWRTIFGKLPHATLSKIYRDMRCQHHLVSESLADVPQIPALTPDGFQEWMTAMIQAYPDSEYNRLSRAVLDMPISNADDFRERFPKELPRRLFPQQENLQAQQRCAAILSAEHVGPLHRAPTFPPPPPKVPNSAPPPPSLERERNPYVHQPDSRAIESDFEDDEPLAVPLERERKPYSSIPGGGKVYDDEQASKNMRFDTGAHEQRKRAQSTASQWGPYPTAPPQHHPRTGSHVNGRRPKSPSFSNYGTRSDSNVSDMAGGYSYTNAIDSEEDRRFARDAEMKRNEWVRRQAEEDAAAAAAAAAAAGGPRRSNAGSSDSYGSQPRSVYDDDYYRSKGGSNGYDNRGYDSRRY